MRPDGEPNPQITWPEGLPIPWLVRQYHANINGIDRIAQMVSVFIMSAATNDTGHHCLHFLLMAALVNAYRICTINDC